MPIHFHEHHASEGRAALAEFLCAHEWPFHGRPRLSEEQVEAMSFFLPDARTFWVLDENQEQLGLLRAQDLGDIDDGAMIFDLRIAPEHQGKGVGTSALIWLTSFLFSEYPSLHRIEAHTRGDNIPMCCLLEKCGYTHEGTLRESWPAGVGVRKDTCVFGMLRSDRNWGKPIGELR